MRPLEHGRWLRAGAAALPCFMMCALACTQPGQAPSVDGNARGSAAIPPFDLSLEAPWPAPYAGARSWARAASGDDLDHAQLAQHESAASLLEAIAHGGSLGRTALRALAYAPDRREARGGLCALAARAEPATLQLLTAALLEVIAHAPLTEEAVDPRADAECRRILAEIAGRPTLAAADKDRLLAAVQELVGR